MLPPSSVRNPVSPDSARATVAVADLDALVPAEDRAIIDAQVSLVTAAPGAALLVWGAEAVCLAYNRYYRTLSSLRGNPLGKPLLRAQPELERAWKPKLELAYSGVASAVDGSVLSGGVESVSGEQHLGWFIPLRGGDGGSRGALVLFMDASQTVEPMRRMLGAVAHDLREPVIGIQVVAERLARLPKPTRERCVEDMERITDLAQRMDHVVDDLGAFARRSGGGSGARLSLRHGDLGSLVRSACERLNAVKDRPILVNTTEAQGIWDEEAIQRIVTTLVLSARDHTPDGGKVVVDVGSNRESVVLSVRDEGPSLRGEEAEQLFEPWKRAAAPGTERRRRGSGIGLFLARELVVAHGGRIVGERPPQGGFMIRVVFPIPGHEPSSRPGSDGAGSSPRGRLVTPPSGPRRA